MKHRVAIAIIALGLAVVCIVVFQRREVTSPQFGAGAARPPGKVAPQLAGSWDGAMLLTPDGSLWWWGGSQPGGFNPFSPTARAERPRRVGNDWREIHSGMNYIVARKADGSWWGCGQNSHGELGVLPAFARSGSAGAPQRLPFEFEPWSFAAGSCTTTLLTRDGALWTWGIRLGTIQPLPLKDRLSQLVDRIYVMLPGKRSARGFGAQPLVDFAPHKVWQLPASAVESANR